jgi:hypothetical protein
MGMLLGSGTLSVYVQWENNAILIFRRRMNSALATKTKKTARVGLPALFPLFSPNMAQNVQTAQSNSGQNLSTPYAPNRRYQYADDRKSSSVQSGITQKNRGYQPKPTLEAKAQHEQRA